MVGFAELVVDDVDVEVQLADVFGFGLSDFEFEGYESAQPEVEEWKNSRFRK